jgi:hypothetical protein
VIGGVLGELLSVLVAVNVASVLVGLSGVVVLVALRRRARTTPDVIRNES